MAEIFAVPETDRTRLGDNDMDEMEMFNGTRYQMSPQDQARHNEYLFWSQREQEKARESERKADKMRPLEGKRFKLADEPGFFFVLDGMTRHIEDPKVYSGMFGDDANQGVQKISWDEFLTMSGGPAITADPPLISPPEGGPVWLIDEGRKRWVRDPDTMQFYGFKFEGVVRRDGKEYPDGIPIMRQQ